MTRCGDTRNLSVLRLFLAQGIEDAALAASGFAPSAGQQPYCRAGGAPITVPWQAAAAAVGRSFNVLHFKVQTRKVDFQVGKVCTQARSVAAIASPI